MSDEIVRVCGLCKKQIATDEPIAQGQDAKGEAPAILAHEKCALQHQLANAQAVVQNMSGVLAGILHKLGGQVVLMPSDIQAGLLECQGNISIRQDEDKTLRVTLGEERRVVLASPGDPLPAVAQLPRRDF